MVESTCVKKEEKSWETYWDLRLDKSCYEKKIYPKPLL
jgi:hypothetical protein